MRRIIPFAVLCLLSALTQAQQVAPPDEPAPLTLHQLVAAESEARDGRDLLSYLLNLELRTLDDEGRVTGSKEGAWRVMRLGIDRRVERVRESRSTLKNIRLSGQALARWVESLPVRFFDPECPARLVRSERRGDGWALLYRTTYAGQGKCFDGLVWVDEAGRVLEADGRREPARRFIDGEESVYPRIRMKMNAEGRPAASEGEDVLTYFSVRDKHGAPLRVRIRLSARYSEYKRPRASEPVVTYGDIVLE